jgi:protein-tyrosine phosphatase
MHERVVSHALPLSTVATLHDPPESPGPEVKADGERQESARSSEPRMLHIAADYEEEEQDLTSSCRQPSFDNLCCGGLLPESFQLAEAQQQTLNQIDQGELLAVLDGRLYLGCIQDPTHLPQHLWKPHKQSTVYIALKDKFSYIPLCADFGPFNLGTMHYVCTVIVKLLRKHTESTRLVLCTSSKPTDVTNAIYLLGAFLVLFMGLSPEEAMQPFLALGPALTLPFRDATWAEPTFDLTLRDCWAGLLRAVKTNVFNVNIFDRGEYFYYNAPENGEMHEVLPGKFIAFKGPVDKRHEDSQLVVPGAMQPADFLAVFKSKYVKVVVRLNDPVLYHAADFVDEGFQHVDLIFNDNSAPPDAIVDKFLRIAEQEKGIVAVHCMTGLGPTATLIGLYMMKHLRFTARETIAWLRIARPGSVIGTQQSFLVHQEARMHHLKDHSEPGLGSSHRNLQDQPDTEDFLFDTAYSSTTYSSSSSISSSFSSDNTFLS